MVKRYPAPVAMADDAGAGLTTARLLLRRYAPEDLSDLIALNSDPDVMRHLGGPMTADASEQMLLGRILRYYDEHPGFGAWATCRREDGAVLGFHLLNHIQGETLIQVGYRLHRRYWGLGYASEMCAALLHYGYQQRQLSLIVATATVDNLASQQVLQKCGLARCGQRRFPHPAYAAFGDLAYFERERADWLAESSAASSES